MAFTPFTENDQPTMEAFNKKFLSVITEAVSSSQQIEVGTYQGTGLYGASNPVSLSFSKKVLLAVVIGVRAGGALLPAYKMSERFTADGYYISGSNSLSVSNENSHSKFSKISQDGKTVQFYSSNQASDQANSNGVTYIYIGFLESAGGRS